MAKTKMTDLDKAAVLLRFLGEDVAAKVLEKLNDREIKKIASNMGQLELITPDMIRSVVDDQRGDKFITFDTWCSAYLTRLLSGHLESNLWLVEEILGVKMGVSKMGKCYRITR